MKIRLFIIIISFFILGICAYFFLYKTPEDIVHSLMYEALPKEKKEEFFLELYEVRGEELSKVIRKLVIVKKIPEKSSQDKKYQKLILLTQYSSTKENIVYLQNWIKEYLKGNASISIAQASLKVLKKIDNSYHVFCMHLLMIIQTKQEFNQLFSLLQKEYSEKKLLLLFLQRLIKEKQLQKENKLHYILDKIDTKNIVYYKKDIQRVFHFYKHGKGTGIWKKCLHFLLPILHKKELLELLTDDNYDIREYVLRKSKGNSSFLYALRHSIVKEKFQTLRVLSFQRLGAMKTEKSFYILFHLLKHKELGLDAYKALSQFSDKQFIQKLLIAQKFYLKQNGFQNTLKGASLALVNIGKSVVPYLEKMSQRGSMADILESIKILGYIKSKKAVRILIRILLRHNYREKLIIDILEEAFFRHGKEAIFQLSNLVTQKLSVFQKALVVKILEKLKSQKSPSFLKKIIFEEKTHYTIRLEAMKLLEKRQIDLTSHEFVRLIQIKIRNTEDVILMRNILCSIGKYKGDQAILQMLLKQMSYWKTLDAPSYLYSLVYKEAITSLGKFHDEKSFRKLLSILQDRTLSIYIKSRTIKALWEIISQRNFFEKNVSNKSRKKLYHIFSHHIFSTSYSITIHSLKGLSLVGDTEIIELLVKHLSSSDYQIRHYSAALIVHYAEKKHIGALISILLTTSPFYVFKEKKLHFLVRKKLGKLTGIVYHKRIKKNWSSWWEIKAKSKFPQAWHWWNKFDKKTFSVEKIYE